MLSAAGLQDHEKLVVSFEGIVYEVAKYGSKQLPYAVNNHIESDTRMFLLLSTLLPKESMGSKEYKYRRSFCCCS